MASVRRPVCGSLLGGVTVSTSVEVSQGNQAGIDPVLAQSFVSRFLARRLSVGGPLADAERHDLHGALLLTDIEDFTGHVERLGGQGAAGLERIASEIDAYFVTVAQTVREFGGDVLGIAGDSFLCLWPASSAVELQPAVARAAAAAATMLRRISALPADKALSLATRAGVSAGELSIILTGGVGGRWELVPTGPAVVAAMRAERHGRVGAVSLTESAARGLGSLGDARPAGEGLWELGDRIPAVSHVDTADPRPPAELMRPFVPLPVLAAGSTASEWLAEFRPVTSLMVSLHDGGNDLDRVQSAVRRFQELMARFGGACKVVFDNKGLTLSGVFGLPPRAHENDIERGLRCARMAFEELAPLYGVRSVGVASGRVLCGVFGSDVRREYSLFGDPINIASRLSGLADGTVLIDHASVHASSLQLRLRPRPDLRVRGRRRATDVMELFGVEVAEPTTRSVVDRDDERSLVLSRMSDVVESGRSEVVLLTGEPGIGKSTVAGQVMRFAEQSGMRRLLVAADAVDRTTPYGPWRGLVGELLGGARDPAALAARLDDADPRLLPLLAPVLPSAPPENATSSQMTGDVRRDAVNDLVGRAVAGAARSQPIALLVEDVQWLDSASWSLLLRIAASAPRTLLLVTERRTTGETGPAEREELLAISGATEIPLRSLGTEHTTALIQHRLGVHSVPKPVLDLVLDRVAGHPLFCESLLQAMVSSGAIRIEEQAASLTPGAPFDVPSSIESSVLSRVDGLRSGHEVTLKAAAVVGRRFTVAEVAATHPAADEAAVSEHLDELRARELIDPAPDADATYVFRHQIVRDVAYGLLTTRQRQPLHRNLASFLEQRRPDEVSSAALLAHHWLAAGDRSRALPYLESAGRAGLQAGAFHEAVRLLERAIGVIGEDDPERRALLEKHLADAQYFLGNLVGGRALLELSLERLGYPVPQTRRSALVGLGREFVRQARLLSGRRAAEPRRSPEALATAVEAHRVLVQISYLHGNSAIELCELTLAALNLGEALGPSAELARALSHAAGVASVLGLRGLSHRYAERALEMAGREEHEDASAYVWNVAAIRHAQLGEWSRAIDANGRALELFGELGDLNFEAELWQTRSALELCRGDAPAAERAWRRTEELASRTGSEVNRCWSLLDQAQTFLLRDEVAPAGVALDRALTIPTPGSDGGTVIERWATSAATRCRQRRYAEAVADADAVLKMVSSSLPTGWVWAEMTALAVEVLLEVRAAPNSGVSSASLDRRLAQGLRALRRLAFTFHGVRARTHVLRGRAALGRGATDAARRSLRRAEAAIVADAPIDLARVALLRAELAPVAERPAILAAAMTSLEELGQLAEIGRAEELLVR